MQDERVLNLSLSVSKPGALRGSKEVGLQFSAQDNAKNIFKSWQ